jgi:hypothetical protein
MPVTQFIERYIHGFTLPLRKAVLKAEPRTSTEALRAAVRAAAQQIYLTETEQSTIASTQLAAGLAKKVEKLTWQVSNLTTDAEVSSL